MATRRARALAVIALLATLVGLETGCVLVPPSSADAGEAATISDALERSYAFPVMSKLVPQRPAMGARPGLWDTSVEIIGVVDPVEQEKVIAILRNIRARLAKKPIRLRFYREEVVTVEHVDPTTGRELGWHREPKGLLREERIQ